MAFNAPGLWRVFFNQDKSLKLFHSSFLVKILNQNFKSFFYISIFFFAFDMVYLFN